MYPHFSKDVNRLFPNPSMYVTQKELSFHTAFGPFLAYSEGNTPYKALKHLEK